MRSAASGQQQDKRKGKRRRRLGRPVNADSGSLQTGWERMRLGGTGSSVICTVNESFRPQPRKGHGPFLLVQRRRTHNASAPPTAQPAAVSWTPTTPPPPPARQPLAIARPHRRRRDTCWHRRARCHASRRPAPDCRQLRSQHGSLSSARSSGFPALPCRAWPNDSRLSQLQFVAAAEAEGALGP